ncbi:uncharacterized protein LOC143860252 [Tasmannia lanceolata]|uniref:uncharacterized protein LOC143860252 n=1 Tax=Tasmannia lanceolata TaxID=3420 RepID=UPI0040643E52
MEIAFQRFSIREFASNTRSVDIGKCWPFDEESKDLEKNEVLLPPIFCRKFRWWSDEFEVVKSSHEVVEKANVEEEEEKMEVEMEEVVVDLREEKEGLGFDDEDSMVKICPVCGIFTASTINAVNAHIDSCLAQASREERRQLRTAGKAKMRTPKKRSIVEIFAIAPQIEVVEEEEEGLEAGEGENGKKKRKNKLKKKLVEMKKMKKKKKMKMTHRSVSEKEEVHKHKTPSAVDFSQLLRGSLHNKKSGKKIKDPIGIQKKKPSSMKGLTKKNQLKFIQASKKIAKRQGDPSVFPIHSILKNQNRSTSVKKLSSTRNLQGGNVAKLLHAKHKNRHVRFSGKDDILGDTKVNESALDFQSMENDKHLLAIDEAQEVNESAQDVSLSIIDGSEIQSLHEKNWLTNVHGHAPPPTVVNSINRHSHDVEKVPLGESVDLNRSLPHYDNFYLFNPDNTILSHNLSCAVIPKMLNSVPKQGLSSDLGIHSEGSLPRAPHTSKSLSNPFVNPIERMNSLENIARNATLPSSIAKNVEENEKWPHCSQTAWKNSNSFSLQYQPSGHFSPKDLMSSICSSVELNKRLALKSRQFVESGVLSDPVSLGRDKSIDEGFIGLPLNSQGELIQLHSSGSVGFNQLFKKQNTPLGSVGSFPIYNFVGPKNTMHHSNMKEKLHDATEISNLRWFSEHNYLQGNPTYKPVSSRIDFTELHSTGRTESHFHDTMREKKQGNLDHGSQPLAQPSVRLMGKNVMVGRSNEEVHGFEDGKIWTDKEIITEHFPINVSENSIPRQCFLQDWVGHPVSAMSKENLSHSVESQNYPNSPSLLQMQAVDPRFSHTHLNCQTHLTSRNDLPFISGHHGTKLHHSSHPHPSQQFLYKASKLPENCIYGTGPVKARHQMPISASNPRNTCLQNNTLNSKQCKHKQSLPYSATSDFQIPFSNQECGGYTQPSWAQQSSSSLPQWLQNATRQKDTQPHSSSSQPSDSIAKHHSCPMSGANISPVPYPFVHPSLTPRLPGFKPNSAINSNLRNGGKIRDGEKSKANCFNSPDHVKKTKKRPASKVDESTKSLKKPNIEMQDSNAPSGSKKREYLHGYTQYNAGTSERHAYRDKMVGVGFSGMETETANDGRTASVGSFKFDSIQRSGPIKLSAGAKHILKPSRNMDHDNSRPTHSTIPFAMVTNSGKAPGFQKKPAKIYQF